MKPTKIDSTIEALLATGKGILAADESGPTIEKRFKALEIDCTEASRRAYREMLFTTQGLSEYISGVILYDETFRQISIEGLPFVELLERAGIVPGIKVDMGTVALAGFQGEKVTEGLDGLRERLIEYRILGARFSKWRAVFMIDGDKPSRICVETNARRLAQFAALSQEVGLVPIVEPEVLMGGTHSIERCDQVTEVVLRIVFEILEEHRVRLEQMLLKTGMIVSGAGCIQQAESEEVASRTLQCLRRLVPAAVPGIVFLSGGQGADEATERLNAICSSGDEPWKLSFSFGRALQSDPMKWWKGSPDNIIKSQSELYRRARCNGLAVEGKYSVAVDS